MISRILTVIVATCLAAPISLLAQEKSPALHKVELNQQALDSLGWKLAVQAWTFRKMTLFQTIDTLNGLGIHYIELFPGQSFSADKPEKFDHNSKPELCDELLKKLKDSDVTVVNYGVVGLSKDEAESRKVFDFGKRLGLRTIVAEPPADAFDTIDKLAQEYQINIAIHDHPKPSHYWNPEAVLEVCKDRSPAIGACADLGHWYRSGLVPLECLKKLEGRVISAHLKDLNEAKEDVPLGTGKTNTRALLEEFKRQGVKQPVFSIEYESSEGDALIGNVIKCMEYFNQVATELAGVTTIKSLNSTLKVRG